MDNEALRALIRNKLTDGRLPYDSIPRMWGGPGAGEVCDACEQLVTKEQMLMEGITLEDGRSAIQLHVRCFSVWDHERRVRG
jgi:hypothetical protein